jgi:hypothetical protein
VESISDCLRSDAGSVHHSDPSHHPDVICIVPLLMIPYSVYLLLVSNALYAQAYAKGQEALQTV